MKKLNNPGSYKETVLKRYASGESMTGIANGLNIKYSDVVDILEEENIRQPREQIDRQIKDLYEKSYPLSQITRYMRCTYNRAKHVIKEQNLTVQSNGQKTLPDRSNDRIYAMTEAGCTPEMIAKQLDINEHEVFHIINRNH